MWRLSGTKHQLMTYRIPQIQLVFLSIALLAALIHIIASFILLAYTHSDSQQRQFPIITIYIAGAVAFFAIDAVVLGSLFEFRDCLAASFILTLYLIYYFLIAPGGTDTHLHVELQWTWIAISITLQVVLVLMARSVEQSFGFREFRQVGANQEMQSIYRTALITESLMKLDAMIAFLLMLMSYLFLPVWSERSETWIISIGASIFTIAWTVSLFSAIRREDICLTQMVFLASVIQPGYVIYKLVDLKLNPEHYSQALNPDFLFGEFLTIGLAYVLNRVLLLIYVRWTWLNFGKGLRNKVFVRSTSHVLPVDHLNPDRRQYDQVPQTIIEEDE